MWFCLFRVPALYLIVYSEGRQPFPLQVGYDFLNKLIYLGYMLWAHAHRMSSENSPISFATLAQAFFSICR